MITFHSIQPRHQQGAALVVGLILLMVVTLLGISGMSMARLELLMADNTKQAQYAFQSAENILSSQIQAGDALLYDDAKRRGDVVRETEPIDIVLSDNTAIAKVTAVTTFQQLAWPVGYEIGLVDAVHFEVQADATSTQRGAESIHHGGFFVKAPSGG